MNVNTRESNYINSHQIKNVAFIDIMFVVTESNIYTNINMSQHSGMNSIKITVILLQNNMETDLL